MEQEQTTDPQHGHLTLSLDKYRQVSTDVFFKDIPLKRDESGKSPSNDRERILCQRGT